MGSVNASASVVGRFLERLRHDLRRFLVVSTHPLNLAVFRIVVFGLALAEAFDPGGDVVWYSAVPAVLRVGPPGWQWLLPGLPFGAPIARVMLVVFVIASCLTIVGWKTRFSAIAAAVSGAYVLGLPQFFGKLNHNHHLVWFMAVLAASPCGDALALDSRKREKVSSIAYGFPIRVCWFLIGLIYFFPGFWKVVSVGPAWALSENVKLMMYDKWTELGGFLPFVRVDQYPLAYRVGGVFTLVFECGFLPMMLFAPRLRPYFIFAGPLFHFQTFLFMRIGFYVLVVCYVVFIDWPATFRERRLRLISDSMPLPSPAPSSPTKPLRWVAAILIVGNLICGFAGIDSYPLAVYPRFNRIQPEITTSLEVVAIYPDGSTRSVDDSGVRDRFTTSRWARILRRLAKLEGEARREALDAILRLLVQADPRVRSAAQIRVDSVERSIRPEHWPQNPVKRVALGTFDAPKLGDGN